MTAATELAGTGRRALPAEGRDPFFDVVRAGALLRVVAWHTVAAAWLSWAFAAMPLMFFTAGVMLARSAERTGPVELLRRRARRVLLPLWALGAVVAATGLAHVVALAEPVSWSRLGWAALRWLVPLTDPPAPGWQQGWLTSHLWYLRAYLWMVVAAPLLLAASRRLRWSLPVLAGGIVAVEAARRLSVPVLGSGWLRLAAGDATCYGLFAVLGAAWPRLTAAGRTRPPRRTLLAVAGGLGAAAVLWAWWGGLPTGVANDSYPVLALLGAAWLAVVLALRAPLTALGRHRVASVAVRRLNARAVTIYLWHPVAIVVAAAVVPVGVTGAPWLRLALTAVGTALAVAAFGPIEELAAGRGAAGASSPVRRDGGRLFVCGVAAVAVVVLALPGARTAEAAGAGSRLGLPPPSDRAALTDDRFAAADALPAAHGPLAPDAGRLQAALDRWVADDAEITGVRVAIDLDGRTVSAAAADPGVAAPAVDEPFAILSITKLFTASLIVQLAAEGRLDLDAPLDPPAGVTAPARPITARMLLQHASGLENYPDVPGYRPDRYYSAAEAVSLATAVPLRSEPGTQVWYSNANYLWLGLLAEELTGLPYEELVRRRLTGPLGLDGTVVDTNPNVGWAGFASGAVVSTPQDLVRFASALYSTDEVVPAAWADELVDVDEHNVGLAGWPLCPCGHDGTHKRYAGIGHTNAFGGVYHFPLDGVSVLVQVDPVPVDVHATYDQVAETVFAALAA
ncbi:MAG: serine hydrolase [Acidimicrobiales bacterium]